MFGDLELKDKFRFDFMSQNFHLRSRVVCVSETRKVSLEEEAL